MGLRQILGIVSGVIGFVASLLYILEKWGIPVVLPPLPSSGPMFDILLVLAIVGAFGFPVWIGYQIHAWRSKKAEKEPEKVQPSTPFGEARLDPRYEHVQLHVFWPLTHSIPFLSERLGHPKGIKTISDLPRIKYVINYKTRKAFSVGEYAWGLIVPVRLIQMNSETHWCPFYSALWCWKHGFDLIGRAATETDVFAGSSLMPSRVAEPSAEPIPLVMKTSDRGYDPDRAARLDPKFAGVHALFFWPKKYSWEKGERDPHINMPYTKVIIKDKDVFWWGAYAEDLFRKGKIEYNSAPGDFETEDEMLIYLRKRGFNMHPRPVSPKDLGEPASG